MSEGGTLLSMVSFIQESNKFKDLLQKILGDHLKVSRSLVMKRNHVERPAGKIAGEAGSIR